MGRVLAGMRFFVFMTILVNGEELATKAETVEALLTELSVGTEGVAVEVNRSIVSRAGHAGFRLSEGDRVEILRLVGGG